MSFKLKTNSDGSIERCKAWLVTQDYSYKEGLDYDETFNPVVRPELILSVIAFSCKEGLKLHQIDQTTAFLNDDWEETIYVKQPKEFIT